MSFLTFDSMDKTINGDHLFEKRLSSSSLWGCLVLNFNQFVILENLFWICHCQERNG